MQIEQKQNCFLMLYAQLIVYTKYSWLFSENPTRFRRGWIDNSFCFEKHFIRGHAKMQTRMGLALAVMMAMALGHVKAGRLEQMRSLIQPIRQTG